jgi:predicted acylesterase/phospholipase RssA
MLYPKTMLAIAFEGCACRAAFHAGVAAALDEEGFHFPLASGSSSGALCAAATAAGAAQRLPATFRALAGSSIVSWTRMVSNRTPCDMRVILDRALNLTLDDFDLRNAPGEAIVGTTRASTMTPLYFSSREEEDFRTPLLGSCFLPLVQAHPVRHRGELLIDGMITDNLPIEALVERGATHIVAVVNEHNGTAAKSARLRVWHPWSPSAHVYVVHPQSPLRIGRWDFSAVPLERAIEEGFARGRECARSLRALLGKLEPEGGSASRGGVDPDASAQALDNRARHRQTEAGAPLVAGLR